jgi:DNA invertase Pin-like site-specific DNA recombinase
MNRTSSPTRFGRRDIVDELTERHVSLNLGGSVHDPNDPVGRLLFNVLAIVAEFESDLIRARTREGMQLTKAKGRLRGRQPKLSGPQQQLLAEVYAQGTRTTTELAAMFNVSRATVYRSIRRTAVGDEGTEFVRSTSG